MTDVGVVAAWIGQAAACAGGVAATRVRAAAIRAAGIDGAWRRAAGDDAENEQREAKRSGHAEKLTLLDSLSSPTESARR